MQAENKGFCFIKMHLKGKLKASLMQHEVGTKVRQTIKELGGTIPEDLPTTEEKYKAI